MVVRLRLQRWGQRNSPFYRIVAADAKAPRDGKFIEIIGTYNPMPNKDGVKEITTNSDRAKYWMSVGAQPSEKVAWLFAKIDILPPPPTKFSASYQIPKSLKTKAK